MTSGRRSVWRDVVVGLAWLALAVLLIAVGWSLPAFVPLFIGTWRLERARATHYGLR